MKEITKAMRILAKRQLESEGIKFNGHWEILSTWQQNQLADKARETRYTHRYNVACCLCRNHQLSRSFYYHLSKLEY